MCVNCILPQFYIQRWLLHAEVSHLLGELTTFRTLRHMILANRTEAQI
jgi:hypothetical protein